MKRKQQRILEAIFAHPVSANVQWRDIEALFIELGAEISERAGSRVAVGDKGALTSIRRWLEQHGVEP